jgi:hypothetical protein
MEETASTLGGWLRIYSVSKSELLTRGGSIAWGLGKGKSEHVTKWDENPESCTDFWNDVSNGNVHGIWNLKCGCLYRSGSLKTAARELAKYILDLVGAQEVIRDKGGTKRAMRIIS